MNIKNTSPILLIALLAAMMVTSCVTPRRVNYLQDMEHESQIQLENRFEATICPYDELNILVSAFDQELAKPFNLTGVNGASGGSNGSGYLVDVNGNIQFPVLGTIYVAGMTRLQLQEAIATRLVADGYMTDPFVQVRFSNFKIFFIGAKTSTITVANERCTFLEALALSGGLDNFTRRDRIAVLREVNGRMTMRYLDPRSSRVFDDPYFMLQQNDFIVTESANGSLARNEISYWMGWISTGISFVTMLTTFSVLKETNNK